MDKRIITLAGMVLRIQKILFQICIHQPLDMENFDI